MPLVTVDDEMTVTLIVDNVRSRPLDGSACLSVPAGLTIDRNKFDIDSVSIDQTLTEDVTLTQVSEPTAYERTCTPLKRLFDASIPIPIIRLGSGEEVTVITGESAEQTVYTIDNSRSRFAVAPRFSGALIRWEKNADDVNHLVVPFPEQRPFGWMSPWYSEVTPIATLDSSRPFPGKLDREAFTGEVANETDMNGIPWRGVRLGCDLAHKEHVGLQAKLM